MRLHHILLFCCCIYLMGTPLRAQQIDWISIINYSIPEGSFLNDVDCLDSLRCVFVKSWGIRFSNTVFQTTDGGLQWHYIHKQDTSPIGLPVYHSVAYPTENIIMACGDSGTFVRTTDGGKTWKTSVITPKWQKLLKIQMTTPQYGIIQVDGTYPEYLLATADSGITWDSIGISRPPNWEFGYLENVFAPSPTVFLCSLYWKDSTIIVRSSDRGKTWTYQWNAPRGRDARFYFIDSLNGWMSTGGKTATSALRDIIARTYDGGITWHVQLDSLIPTGWGLSDLSFADSLHGLAVGPEKILRTTDGGKHWRREFMDTVDFFRLRVSYKPGSNGVIVHSLGRVLRYVGHPTSVANVPQISSTFALSPNPVVRGAIPVVSFQLPQRARVRVSLVSVTGEEWLVQPEQEFPAGWQQLPLALGQQPSGLLFLRMVIDGVSFVRPFHLLR